MGVGLGWCAALGLLLLLRLQARPIQGFAGLVPEPADRSGFAALLNGRRQSQLFRRPNNLLSELLGQPGPGACDTSGSRLFECHQPEYSRRRGQLPDELYELVTRDSCI